MKLKILLLLYFLFAFSQKVYAASVVVTDFPNEIKVLEEFNINVSATGLENDKTYYYKCRLGKSDQLNKGETYNSITAGWLGDTESWSSFPSIQSNSSGNVIIDVKCRAKSSIELVSNFLQARIRSVDGGDNLSSDLIEVSVLVNPTNTPTITATPTVLSTSTPVPTSLPTLTPTNTSVPAVTPISYSSVNLNEYLPDPEGGNEKVEIKNNNSFSVNLVNWQFDDIENGGQPPKVFSAQIAAGGLYTIDLGTSFLNNDGDAVRLLDFSGIQKDRRDFNRSSKNLSWQRDSSGNWCEKSSSFDQENSDCNFPTPTPTAVSPTPTVKVTPTPSPTKGPTVTSGTSLIPTPQIIVSPQQTQKKRGEILGTEVFKNESKDEDLFPQNFPQEDKKILGIKKYLFLIPITAGLFLILYSGYILVRKHYKIF